jgi:hypothetical protein
MMRHKLFSFSGLGQLQRLVHQLIEMGGANATDVREFANAKHFFAQVGDRRPLGPSLNFRGNRPQSNAWATYRCRRVSRQWASRLSDRVRIVIAVIRHFLTGGPGGPGNAAVAAC